MATQNERNEVTAEELFNKLVGKEAAAENNDNSFAERLSSINLTDGAADESESDLDINELLRKYLPELENEADAEITDAAEKIADELKEFEAKVEETANDIVEGEKTKSESLAAASFSDGIFTEYELEHTKEEDESTQPEEEIAENAVENAVEDAVADTVEEIEDTAEEIVEDESTKTKEFLDKLLGNTAENVSSDEAPIEELQAEEQPEEENENELSLSDSLFTAADADEEAAVADEITEEQADTADAEEVDSTDINLMIAFDIDNGDEETAAKAKEVGDKLESIAEEQTAKKFVLDRPEYIDKSQTAEIRKEFKKKKASLTIRTILCAAFAILLFVFENISSLTQLFGGHAQQFSGALDPALYPVVYIMVSLQLMLLCCLCALPEIISGFKSLFKGIPTPESLLSVMAVAGIIYSVVLCNLIKSPNEPVMLNFAVAFAAFMTLVSASMNNKREMMNFRIVSNKKIKHVVRRMTEEDSVCEAKAFEGADDVCDVMKIEKTGFVDNFFTRLRTPVPSNGTSVMFIIGATVALGAIFGIITGLRRGYDAATAWRTVFAAMYLVAPISIMLAFAYPFYRANRVAKDYDSAIIGETSLEEYSNASIISFDDKNVFPSYSVKVQNIRIYNNARIDRVLYYASSVFSFAGGPLQDVFEITTKDMGTSDNVQIFDTEDGFLATQVDGVNIIFGSYDALVSRGLEIPDKAAEDDVDLSDELSIMYMFRESVLVAKMYIKYDMDEDIDVILKQFAGDGLYVCVRTFDPNIDEKMIANKLGEKKVPLKIVRYSNTDEVGKYEAKSDSGLVSCSSPKSLLQVISYCEKVIHTKKTNAALAILSVVIGAGVLLLLLLAGAINMLTSLLIALYQLVWLIPTIIATKASIR